MPPPRRKKKKINECTITSGLDQVLVYNWMEGHQRWIWKLVHLRSPYWTLSLRCNKQRDSRFNRGCNGQRVYFKSRILTKYMFVHIIVKRHDCTLVILLFNCTVKALDIRFSEFDKSKLFSFLPLYAYKETWTTTCILNLFFLSLINIIERYR